MMADTAAWLGAVGGAVGALGGPAGLWAAYQLRQQQHREDRRREALRLAPSPEVLRDLLVVKAEAQEIRRNYRDAAWWESTPAKEAIRRLGEAEPALRSNPVLQSTIGVVRAHYSHASILIARDHMEEHQRMSRVAGQRSAAVALDEALDTAIERVQDAIHAAQA
jgi:hypothetical protein